MAKKTKDKKKKGPKGKKARAKARLEQVWGETYNIEERNASKVRIGKSRHQLGSDADNNGITNGGNKKEKEFDALAKKRRGIIPATFDDFLQRKERINNNGYTNQRKQEAKVSASSDESSSDDDDSESDNDAMNNIGSGYATLLKRISGVPKQKQKVSSRDMDIDSDIETSSSSSSEDESDSESSSDDEESDNNMDEDEESSYDSTDPTIEMNTHEDPYESHFSKRPLPEKGSSTTTITTLTQLEKHQQKLRTLQYKKVVPISTLHKSIEVQISGPLQATYNENTRARLQEAGVTEERGTDLSWNQLSLGPYNHVRQVLTRNWKSINTTKKNKKTLVGRQKIFTPYQTTLYTALARYSDVLLTNENRINRIDINNLLSLHVVNHVLTSRTRVQRHNRRIKELSNKSNDNDKDEVEEEDSDKHRDQGYTRPKVLILLPTKGVCWDFVQCMISLLGDSASVDNIDRFNVEYGPLDSDNNSDEDDEEEDVNKKRRRKTVLKQKGHEWNELFGDTINSDDDFKIGLSLTPRVVKQNGDKKKSKKVTGEVTSKEGEGSSSSGVNVKLFADFYHCDIILASPIGLKMATTNDEDDGNNDEDEDEQADTDFLSSIDICLVTRSDVLLMQNWDHVNTILDSTLNNQPKKIDGIDFSRVRNYFLEGQAKYWRQLIVVSSFSDPYVLSTFRRHTNNVEGSIKIRSKVSNDDASICEVMVRTKQVFQRVTCTSVADSGSNRLRYFSEHVLPKLTRLNQKHTLIYIPSYFDFIAVRNLLLKREVNFVSVTEYARVSEVSRGRARFLQGRKSIMLYTGRAHFFLRHKIKGARHVIFFGLPEYADFYPNVVNMLSNDVAAEDDEDGDITRMPMSCLSLFTKFDAHQLQRVVGTSHTEKMIKGEKSSYMFSS